MIKELNVGSIGGIHYEMYDPDPQNLYTEQILHHYQGKPDFLDLNGVFWSEVLSNKNIEKLIDDFLESYNENDELEPYEQMIHNFPDLFVNTIQEAKDQLCEQGISEKEYFGCLETLAITCKIYSDLYFSPFELTIHEGFLLESYSSMKMLSDCLVPAQNPYYYFLDRYVWKVLLDLQPQCVWINGKMTIANMAIAKFLKRGVPGVNIFWALPGSEYYATNKIEEYLKYNTPLFSVIDGIVLDDFENTRKHIIDALEHNDGLEGIYNLMYSKKVLNGDIKIFQGEYKKYQDSSLTVLEITKRIKRTDFNFRIAPWEIVNVKLFPQKICSWNKCTFCGINKKYRVQGQESELENKIKELSKLQDEGCKYFWFIDEEISAGHMEEFAKAVIESNMQIKWQIRARLSRDFTDRDLCKLLAEAGLREIRFGLESASYRILNLMNKFDDDFSLELAEQIVATFEEVGVAVHFPVIVGFPGETDIEREQTYQFLSYLRSKYNKFSFNVNVIGLDVSSMLFKNWQHYGITRISFPCNPHYFLGNLVDWDCADTPFLEDKLKMERDEFMREQLYPWMPENALVYPHIFYRLMETARNTLTIKDRENEYINIVQQGMPLRWNPSVVVCSNLCYNVRGHQNIITNIDIMSVKRIFELPITIEEASMHLKDCLVGYTIQNIQDLISQLYNQDFLIVN